MEVSCDPITCRNVFEPVYEGSWIEGFVNLAGPEGPVGFVSRSLERRSFETRLNGIEWNGEMCGKTGTSIS